jgi:hypothetical protein
VALFFSQVEISRTFLPHGHITTFATYMAMFLDT